MKLNLALSLPVLAAAAKYSDDDYRSGRVHEMSMGRKEVRLTRRGYTHTTVLQL